MACNFCFQYSQVKGTQNLEYLVNSMSTLHRGLRRLVLIEFKLGEFEPQDKGQTELYLRWLEKYERAEGEESPIALILCAEKSQETIELMQLDHGNIHVGQYLTKMPPKELLEQKLSLAIANAKEQLEQRKKE